MTTVPFNSGRKYPLPADIAKKLPHNPDAERAVLGAILLDNQALKIACAEISVEDFFLPQHRVIFRSMAKLEADDQQVIDILTLNDELSRERLLEAAGGPGYLSSLVDGIPKISNVKYYAEIVREDAKRRRVIHEMYRIEQLAYEENVKPEELHSQIDTFLKQQETNKGENPAVVVGFQSVLTRECAPIEYAIEPLLSKRGTGEIYGWRGTGKSYFSTKMGVEIATGSQSLWGGHRGGGGHWPVSRPFRQLYVYGEMDESEIQERIRQIARTEGVNIPTDKQFGTICMDYQKSWRPKISTARDRKFIEDRLFEYGYEGLWLDNLSTLWPASQEAQSDRDAILAEWFTDLNQRGIWVIFLHHAGKSGEQRGGSEKEDMLSFVIKLRRPANYKAEEQLRIEVHIEKNRHKCISSRMLMPFEIQLTKNALGQNEWVTRPAQAAQRKAAFEMFKNKMPTMLVGQEVGVSRATAYRWFKDFNENPNPDFHLTAED
jgi:replicative DNA helicase